MEVTHDSGKFRRCKGNKRTVYLRSVIHDGCKLLAATNGFLILMFTDSKLFHLKSSLALKHMRAHMLRAAQQNRSACFFMCKFALLKYLMICCSEQRKVCRFCGFIETFGAHFSKLANKCKNQTCLITCLRDSYILLLPN